MQEGWAGWFNQSKELRCFTSPTRKGESEGNVEKVWQQTLEVGTKAHPGSTGRASVLRVPLARVKSHLKAPATLVGSLIRKGRQLVRELHSEPVGNSWLAWLKDQTEQLARVVGASGNRGTRASQETRRTGRSGLSPPGANTCAPRQECPGRHRKVARL